MPKPSKINIQMARLKNSLLSRIGRFLPEQDESLRSKDAGEFWAESESSESRQDHSHWLGAGRWKKNKWEDIGKNHYLLWEMFKKSCGDDQVYRKMAEWGPGGGSNAIAFLAEFNTFYGIDISEANLKECQKQISNRHLNGFAPIHIGAESFGPINTVIQSPLDFFLSTAVFQHFPGKGYGKKVLGIVFDMLRQGGLAIIQIRYEDQAKSFKSKKRDYKANAITFTSYQLEEFWQQAELAGFDPCYLKLMPETNYAYFFLRKQ
jgi:methylase of polypeptide subunit release factors